MHPSEHAPLALLYHENSKITDATATHLAERVAEFTTDVDELRRSATGFKTYPDTQRVDLQPFLARPFPIEPLDKLLARRRTIREFSDESVPLATLALLLERAAGVTGEMSSADHPEIRQPVRAHPSGGALYPMEIYVAAFAVDQLPAGIYHFHAPQHCLERVREGSFREDFERNLWIAGERLQAPVLLVLTGRWNLALRKYGERGYRILLLDAGHLMQNLLLTATALNLATCPLAGFHDEGVAKLLAVDAREEPPLYVLALGTRG